MAPTQPQMIVVPEGGCEIGSPEGERGRARDGSERPVTAIRFARGFLIGRFPVMVADFSDFATQTGFIAPRITAPDARGHWAERAGQTWHAPGFMQRGDHPVVGLCWHDAVAYADWIAARFGKPYRLPTEEEWEFAARAAGRDRGPWGSVITGAEANYDNRYTQTGLSVTGFRAATVPVGSFAANDLGIHEMLGNVWEWCARTPEMMGEARQALAPLRGGSWANGPWCLRPACRLLEPASFRHATFGVRLALDLV